MNLKQKVLKLKALYGYEYLFNFHHIHKSNANTINDDTNGVTRVDESISSRRSLEHDTKTSYEI